MKKTTWSAKTAIETIEEAVHLLRISPINLLSPYYIGSLPFVLGLLYFWGDMSRNAFADEYCVPASMGTAVLFIWMKCWHSVFAVNIMAMISKSEVPAWSFRSIMRLVATQTITQPSGLFLVPLALVLAFPFGWVYAFYQNLLVQPYDKTVEIKNAITESVRQAKLWPGQNHIILYIMILLGFITLFNVGIVISILPYILKKYLGIETVFTMSGINAVLNTTFLATVCGVTFLCTDPLVKTVYVLRCFYGLSLMSGDDLKARLRYFFPHSKLTLGLMLLVITGSVLQYVPALASYPADTPSGPGMAVSPDELDSSIKEIMTRREFTWRMPREKKEDNETLLTGPFEKFIKWVRKIYIKLKEIVLNWLEEIQPKLDLSQKMKGGWKIWVRLLFYLILIFAVILLAVYLVKYLIARKKNQIQITDDITPAMPDLTDDNVKADELPADQWKALALELIEKGSLRLALRALYLATLAYLAEEKLISIAKYKSNRDYETELKRRAHEKKELLGIFSANVNFFDRVWYGMYEINIDDVNLFADDQERIFSFARQ
ncbi:MAG: hypothetical protein GY749_40140 [Desulfobacteraceae bacterium]|nr:hypothetical protein [Desulfobacteraceae bacterium]